MRNPARLFFLVGFFALLPAGCTGGGDGNDYGGGDVANVSTNFSGQCSAADDCAYWFCHCDDGQSVNSRNCTNGQCLHADDICGGTCEDFGSSWSGDFSTPGNNTTSGSGNNNGSNTGGGSTNADECSVAGDCPYWYCYCDDGSPVNARTCDNGQCEHANSICGGACADFGKTWSGDYGSSSNGGGSGSGGGGGTDNTAQCDAFFTTNDCGNCGYSNCCDEAAACDDNSSCMNVIQCIVNCVNNYGGQAACEVDCKYGYPSGADDFDDYEACMDNQCWSECH